MTSLTIDGYAVRDCSHKLGRFIPWAVGDQRATTRLFIPTEGPWRRYWLLDDDPRSRASDEATLEQQLRDSVEVPQQGRRMAPVMA